MKIADIEVDDDTLAEYIEKVRHMIERSRSLPPGVQIQIDDREREELHEEILDKYDQSRGSAFDLALRDYVEKLGSKEKWFLTWDDLP